MGYNRMFGSSGKLDDFFGALIWALIIGSLAFIFLVLPILIYLVE